MRQSPVVKIVAFFVIAVVILAGALIGSSLLFECSRTTVTSSNIIVLKNAHPGTNSWKIPIGKTMTFKVLCTKA
jgi:hypothetical protein